MSNSIMMVFIRILRVIPHRRTLLPSFLTHRITTKDELKQLAEHLLVSFRCDDVGVVEEEVGRIFLSLPHFRDENSLQMRSDPEDAVWWIFCCISFDLMPSDSLVLKQIIVLIEAVDKETQEELSLHSFLGVQFSLTFHEHTKDNFSVKL